MRFTWWFYIPNIKALGLVVSDKKIFKFSSRKSFFSLCDLDMQWTITIWAIIKEYHIRLIPSMFGKNPARSLGENVLWSNCWRGMMDDIQSTMDDRHLSTTIAHHEPMAKVKLKELILRLAMSMIVSLITNREATMCKMRIGTMPKLYLLKVRIITL